MTTPPGTSDALVCLSPHPDDAALSCGGLLAMLQGRGWSPHVVTVCAGPAPPPEELTPFARYLHRSWGDLADPVAHRRQEDACALDALGCTGTWWSYRDAIYRHPAYDAPERLFGSPAEEPELLEELLARCADLPGGVLLFPLGIGHHVDHQLLFRVGWRLGESFYAAGGQRRVAFYEDLPYVAWESGLHLGPGGEQDRPVRERLDELSLTLYPQRIDIAPFWPLKEAAVSCYGSQFAELTRDGVPLLEALARYAAALLPEGYAERLWWPEEGSWI